MASPELQAAVKRWGAHPEEGVRVVCFGSSNTAMLWHSEGWHNWCGWLECCLRGWLGGHIHVVNAGISGDTSGDLLNRFGRDVAPHVPSAVIVTIGGNDAARAGRAEYRGNLERLIALIREQRAMPVLQTYYAMLHKECDPKMGENLAPYMETCVDTASSRGVPCIDQFSWFEPWYRADPVGYRQIMRDPAHLNPMGNCLMGILCARSFALPDPLLPKDMEERAAGLLAEMEKYAALPAAIVTGKGEER